MKRLKMVLLIAISVSLTVVTAAQAETLWLRSKVMVVNTTSSYLKLYRLNTQTNKIEEIKVDVEASTQFYGFNSLADLSPEDKVSVEVNYDEFNSEYRALQIKIQTSQVPRVLTVPPPVTLPPLISGSRRLFQYAIEEVPRQSVSSKASESSQHTSTEPGPEWPKAMG